MKLVMALASVAIHEHPSLLFTKSPKMSLSTLFEKEGRCMDHTTKKHIVFGDAALQAVPPGGGLSI